VSTETTTALDTATLKIAEAAGSLGLFHGRGSGYLAAGVACVEEIDAAIRAIHAVRRAVVAELRADDGVRADLLAGRSPDVTR
jgi:hypothetical protein